VGDWAKNQRFFVALSGALSLICLASSSYAQSVTIHLEGEVPSFCRLETSTTQILLGELTNTGRAVFPFRVRCNTPFHFSLFSRNGALVTGSDGPLRPGFRATVPYEAAVNIPTSAGFISGACGSDHLRATAQSCIFPDSRGGIALTGEATITVNWSLGADILVAGTYTDSLTLEVGARF
jgi:hypothetical protein